MRLDKNAGNSNRRRGPGKNRHKLAFATGRRPLPAGLLDGMGGVENDRRLCRAFENRQRAHIGHERVVAKRHPALCHQDISVSRPRYFFDDVLHVPRRQELALLHVDCFSGLGSSNEEIGLATKKSGNLQPVHDRRDLRALLGIVHVGEDGHLQLVPNLRKDWQSGFEPEAARRFGRCSIGLVERCFVNKANPRAAGYFLQGGRHFQCVRFAFKRTRPGNQRQRQRVAEAHAADRNGGVGLLIHGVDPRGPDHEAATAFGQRASRAAGSNTSTAPIASSDPITVAFPAKSPAIPACSGTLSKSLGSATTNRNAARRAPLATSGGVTPNRLTKAAGLNTSISPRGVGTVKPPSSLIALTPTKFSKKS